MPPDAIEISAEMHALLLQGQADGQRIVAGTGGIPTLEDPTTVDAAAILASRRAAMFLSFRQLMRGLVADGWITEAEGEGWLRRNALPAAIEAWIDDTANVATADRFGVLADLLGMTQADRLNPVLLAMAAARGLTDTDIDTFFDTWSQV